MFDNLNKFLSIIMFYILILGFAIAFASECKYFYDYGMHINNLQIFSTYPLFISAVEVLFLLGASYYIDDVFPENK